MQGRRLYARRGPALCTRSSYALRAISDVRASGLQAASGRGPGLCASLHGPSLAPCLVAVVTMQPGYDGIFFYFFLNSVFWIIFIKRAFNPDGYWRFITPRSPRYRAVLAPL